MSWRWGCFGLEKFGDPSATRWEGLLPRVVAMDMRHHVSSPVPCSSCRKLLYFTTTDRTTSRVSVGVAVAVRLGRRLLQLDSQHRSHMSVLGDKQQRAHQESSVRVVFQCTDTG